MIKKKKNILISITGKRIHSVYISKQDNKRRKYSYCWKEGKPFTGTVTTTLEDFGKSKTAQILSLVVEKIPTIGNLVGTIKEVNTILNDPDDRSIDKMLSILEKRPKQLMKIRLIA